MEPVGPAAVQETISADKGFAMHIVMVAARYYPFLGGIETHIHEVGTRMAALGHQVTVLTTDPTGALPSKEDVCGMRIKRVRAWPKNRDYYFSPGLYRQLSQGQWDIIHFQGYHTFAVPIGLLAAVRRDVPFVLTFHSGGHSSPLRNALRRPQHAMLAHLVARASRLIAVSRYEAEFFSRRMRLDHARFAVVPNGASLPPPSTRSGHDRNLVVSIGRLERYKGHHRVIAAFPELLRRVPEARLQIVGSGPYERELRGLVRILGLEERVAIGAIASADRQSLSDLLASAGLVVLLSEYEAHPVAIMEALSLRRRALVGDTSGLRELAELGLCRSIPLDASPSAVAGAMAEELESEHQVPDFALPDWNACARQLLGIYESVLNGIDRASPFTGGDRLRTARSGIA
jgi:glycosyltransferase involved in cell wall biosynthesis